MPIYEYECQKCGAKFDLYRSFYGQETKVKCPECGAEDTRRVFSPFCSSSSTGSCEPSHFT